MSRARRLRLRLPERCPSCRFVGSVRLESTVTGDELSLKWCCHACSHEWAVTEQEESLAERRSGIDRRRITRQERRKHS